MGDQLISCDNLLSTLLLYDDDPNASRRVEPLTIARTLLAHKAMIQAQSWESAVYRNLFPLARKHIEDEISVGVHRGSPYRKDPVNALRGNLSVWIAFMKIWTLVKKDSFVRKYNYDRYLTRLEASVDSAIYRSGPIFSHSERIRVHEPITENRKLICQLTVAESILWEIHTIRARELNAMVGMSESYEYEQNPTYIHETLPVNMRVGIDLSVMGSLVYLKVDSYQTCITKVHFERLCKLIRTFLLVSVVYPSMDMRVDYNTFLDELLAAISPVIHEDVDFLGECLKASKALIISSLDDSMIPGVPLVESYSEAITPKRRRLAKFLASTIRRLTRTAEAAVNLTNLFKAFPHPDANMFDLFESIKGVQHPNRVERDLIPRFSGVLRRSIFASLSLQNYDVRVRAIEQNSPSKVIEDATFATRRRDAALRTYSASTWAGTYFEPIQHFIDISNIEIKPSSKSSQKAPKFERDDLLRSVEYLAGQLDEKPVFLEEARTVNDATTDLLGESELNPAVAIDRFIRVVEAHQAFEARFANTPIDDISPEELAEFVENNPEARYLVGTEPKFGEIHKKVTRMFYMAQQYLKVITQMLERYTKQVCRKQPGVSITKSYAARRKDLENFCHSMTGPLADKKSVFVSFDMSEFSKKFPMELVREFGKVLAELSGHDWMRRIDLVFRASIVIHNSRGFFSKLSGIRGGFEGFFNFIWSSIHITIMEISLEATGLQGETLVFSDDGILMFYCPQDWSNQKIYNRIMRIQKIYERFGLSFHLGKSMVSYNVWEYLGDVCCNNRLLPMWLKEVSSITRNVKNRGLEPFYTKIKSMQAQCDAAIMSGCPVLHSYIIKRYFFGSLIDRLGITYNPQLEELLAIVPSSAGGLRITSPFEASFVGTIEKDAEIIADIELLRRLDSNLADVIIYGIKDSLRYSGNIAQAIISGTRFITDHPDVSGMKSINECIDMIKNSGRTVKSFPRNPMGTEFKSNIVRLLESLDYINLDIITDFIYSTPIWTEYNNAMAVIRSSGVLRLIPRRELVRIQAFDTRRVKQSIDIWHNYLVSNRKTVPRGNIMKLLELAEARTFKGLSLTPLRLSPRLALQRGGGKNGIIVRLELSPTESYYQLDYAEPLIRLSKDETTLAWASEGVVTSRTRSVRKFMNSVARILSFSPESEGALINIGRLIGVDIPPIAPGLVRGAHRIGGGRGRDVDAKVFLPRWFLAQSEARYYGQEALKVYQLPRADRTTYLEASRVMSYFIHIFENKMLRPPRKAQLQYRFTIKDHLIVPIHQTVPMIMRSEFRSYEPVETLSDDVVHEYVSAYKEFVDSGYREMSMTDASYLMNFSSGCDLDMIKSIYTNSLKKWLVSARHNAKMTLLNSVSIPLPRIEVVSILLDSVVEASLSIIPPQSRRVLLDRVNSWTSSLSSLDIYDIEKLVIPQDLAESREFLHFVTEVREMIEVLSENAPDELPAIDLGVYAATSGPILSRLLRYAHNMNLLNKQKLVIIRSNKYSATKMTPAHRVAFREAFTATLSALYSYCRNFNWDKKRVKEEFQFYMDPDDLITCLIVLRDLLRESEHRPVAHPYNGTSARIEMFKFYRTLNHLINEYRQKEELDKELTDDDIDKIMFTPPLTTREVRDIVGRFKLKPTDTDHMMMLRTPVLPQLKNRILEYFKGYINGVDMGYGRKSTYDLTLEQVNNLLSAFYQTIIDGATRAMTEYSAELEDRVLNTFNPSVPASTEMLSLESMVTELSGSHVDIDLLDPREKTDLITLLRIHSNDLCIRAFIRGLRAHRGERHEVPMIIADNYDAEGFVCAWASDHETKEDDVDIWVYALEHTDPTYALSDFVLLSKCERASVSVLNLNGSDRYLVIGLTDRKLPHMPFTFLDEAPVKAGPGVDIQNIIPRISLVSQASHIKAMANLLTVSSLPQEEAFNRIKMISSRTRRVDRRSQVVDNSVVLLAAYNLLNESPSNDVIFAAYVGVYLWLKNEVSPSRIRLYAERIRREISKASDPDRFRILLDIANTAQWLSQSKLTAGISVDDSAVVSWMVALEKIKFNYRVPPSGVIAALRTLDEVYENLHAQSNMLGNISKFLYKPEELKAIGWVEKDFTEEEEQEIDEIDL